MDVEVTTANAAGWDIHCNTNEVCLVYNCIIIAGGKFDEWID